MKSIEFDLDTLELLQQRYGIVGRSTAMLDVIRLLVQAAPTDLSVLITGETGTGKEIFATALHGLSNRRKFPFVSVNCGAIPETLLESELFGHERGAFTSANDSRRGFFEVAHRGTIFLDEIGEMPYSTQVKLLRVLESGEFSKLGSSDLKKVDVRVVAATNRNLEQEVASGNFRRDLYFRLKSVHVSLRPLREHPEDIPLLADYFSGLICEKLGIKWENIPQETLNIMRYLPWPGNVRELRNLVETIITLEKKGTISAETLQHYIPAALPPHNQYTQPADVSIVPLPSMEEPQHFELEIIFRTLLELKNDTTAIKQKLSDLNSKIENISSDIFNIQANRNDNTSDGQIFSDENGIIPLAEMEKKMIQSALIKFHGNRRLAANALDISERTLYRKLQEYGIGLKN